jgi:hypothetical protein
VGWNLIKNLKGIYRLSACMIWFVVGGWMECADEGWGFKSREHEQMARGWINDYDDADTFE